MPKKDKDKKQSQGKSPAKDQAADPLPQVWLPDQLEITALSYDKGPRIPAGVEKRGRKGGEETAHLNPPTEEEQESMARFWAMEEANSPKGWEDEEEIDYAEINKKSAMNRGKNVDAGQQLGGDPSLFSYAQTSLFAVKFLGHVPDVPPQSNFSSPESQISTLEAIDNAQRQGRVPWVTSAEDLRVLSLSKYGIKVTDDQKQRVYSRHQLHRIANITYYEDTYGKHMVVLRMGQPQPVKGASNELFVYECSNEAQAKDICLTLAQAFEAVFNKIKLERNLHKPA